MFKNMKTTLYTLLLLVAFVVSPAIQAQTNTPIVFAPELGKKYILSTEVSAALNREATEDRKAKTKTGNVQMTFSFVPKKINEKGNYEIECLLTKVVFKTTNNGEVRDEYNSDIETVDNNEDKLDKMAKVLKQTPLVFEVNKVGQMMDVKGIEELDKKLSEGDTAAGMQRLSRPKEDCERITAIIKTVFNHFTSFYGTKPMQVGDNWTVAADMSILKLMHWPEMKLEDAYTVSNHTGGVITLNGIANYNINLKGDESIVKIAKESVIQIDTATGLVQNAKFLYTAAEPQTEEEKKTKKPELVTVTVLISITPPIKP